MKSFKGLLREELLLEKEKAKKAEATQYEAYLTVAYNGGVGNIKNKEGLPVHTMSGKVLSSDKINNNIAFLDDAIGKSEKDYIKQEPGARLIAKEVYNKFHGEMSHEGKLTGVLSAEWPGWGGTNKTSKTDNAIGNIRLSLKAGAKAQIMSSHVDEAVAIFNSAVDAMRDKKPQGFDHLVEKVESTLSIQVEGKFKIGDFLNPIKAAKAKYDKDKEAAIKAAKAERTKGKNKKSNADIEADAEKNRKRYDPGKPKPRGFWKKNLKGKTTTQGADPTVVTDVLTKSLDQEYFDQTKFQKEVSEELTYFFENNEVFQQWFVFEAMTGYRKFTKDHKAVANWVLNFDYSADGNKGNILHLEELYTAAGKPTDWIKNKSREANIRCNWKNHGMSTKGVYPSIRVEFDVNKIRDRMNSAMRRGGELFKLYNEDYEPEYTSMTELINEELNSFVVSESLLIEEAIQDMQLINEGLLDWGKSKVKKLYDKLKSFLYKIIEKVKATMNKLGKLGMDHVYQFLGVDIKSVDVTSGVRF